MKETTKQIRRYSFSYDELKELLSLNGKVTNVHDTFNNDMIVIETEE